MRFISRLEALFDSLFTSQQDLISKMDEQYLASSLDLADLERKLREIERMGFISY